MLCLYYNNQLDKWNKWGENNKTKLQTKQAKHLPSKFIIWGIPCWQSGTKTSIKSTKVSDDYKIQYEEQCDSCDIKLTKC